MKRRPLGATGISVGEIGLGAWQLANADWGSDAGEARQIIERAVDAGCDFFDTAPGYAAGRSETLLGEVLRPVRDRVTICSKFGHSAQGETDFSVSAIRPALEASLERLQTDYLDVYLLHNPPAELLDGNRTPHYEELERLKTEGKLRAYGVSADYSKALETVIDTTASEVVEVLFNVFHQEPQASFRKAQENGVGLIVKVPLDSGWLSGKYRADSRFEGVRRRWSPEVIARRAVLVEQLTALTPPDRSLTHAALQYVLAQPEVSTIIAGAKTVQQLQDNVAAAASALPEEVVSEIYSFWQRELKDDPLPW